MKYKVALFVGRFQPFHNGHLYSLEKCLELADKVIIAVGSSQESGTENNPWSYETRKRMIEGVLREPTLRGQSSQVVAIPDVFNDQKWGDLILGILSKLGYKPDEVVGVGNNDWTNRILKVIGVAVHESGLYKRDELEGIKIRSLLEQGDETWRDRVPDEVVKYIMEYEDGRKS